MRAQILGWALVVLLVLLGWQTMRLSDAQEDLAREGEAHQRTIAKHADERTQWERESRLAVEAARAEEQRRTAAVQKEADEAKSQLAQSRRDEAAARSAGERLRQRLAALAARACSAPGGAPAADGGAAAAAAGNLLADVQRRLDEAADDLARFADAAAIAGRACERSYNALTAP